MKKLCQVARTWPNTRFRGILSCFQVTCVCVIIKVKRKRLKQTSRTVQRFKLNLTCTHQTLPILRLQTWQVSWSLDRFPEASTHLPLLWCRANLLPRSLWITGHRFPKFPNQQQRIQISALTYRYLKKENYTRETHDQELEIKSAIEMSASKTRWWDENCLVRNASVFQIQIWRSVWS